MSNSFVLKVPDLNYLLNREDVERWEVFWRNDTKQYEQINWQLYYSKGNCALHHVLVFYGRLKAVKIDYQNNCIVFYRSTADQGEFEEFLMKMLDNVFIRSHPDHMHFIICPKYSCRK